MITRKYLKENPDHIFVFGDNLARRGKGGGAMLRDEPNTYGFITKKFPVYQSWGYYKSAEYPPVYIEEIEKLIKEIEANPDKTYLISKLGAGLANKFKIFDEVIKPRIKKDLQSYSNVKFLW